MHPETKQPESSASYVFPGNGFAPGRRSAANPAAVQDLAAGRDEPVAGSSRGQREAQRAVLLVHGEAQVRGGGIEVEELVAAGARDELHQPVPGLEALHVVVVAAEEDARVA